MDGNGRAALCVALARLAGGDRTAQRPVFEALWPVLRVFCQRMLNEPADAEDAAQRAVIRLFEQAEHYVTERDALAWALEIALWECRTTVRRRSRIRERAMSPEALRVAAAGLNPEEATLRSELEGALLVVVGALSEVDRQALADSLTGGQLGAAAATWRKRRERALSRLKLLWRSEYGS